MKFVGAVCVMLFVAACGGSAQRVEFVEARQRGAGKPTEVRFRLLGSDGKASAGASAQFSLEGTQGARLTAKSASADANGIVGAELSADQRVSGVVVVATSGSASAKSSGVVVGGEGADGKHLAFECRGHAVGAYDTTRTLSSGAELPCVVQVADRNGAVIEGAAIQVLAEAGSVTQSGASDAQGRVTVTHRPGLPLPQETEPILFNAMVHAATREPAVPGWMEPTAWSTNPVAQFGMAPTRQEPRRADPVRIGQKLNPRDNLVTMIAITQGAEFFTDTNGNATYDEGEMFEDLAEPFVDANDNGIWDAPETFVDVDGDGQWGAPNAVWDSWTKLWKQEKVLWTGAPHALDAAGTEPTVKTVSPRGPLFVPFLGFYGTDDPMFPGGRVAIPAVIAVADPWFNALAQHGASDGCTAVVEPAGVVTVVPAALTLGPATTYPAVRMLLLTQVKDARDPNTPPAQQVPKRNPPIDFVIKLDCKFTPAPSAAIAPVTMLFNVQGKVE